MTDKQFEELITLATCGSTSTSAGTSAITAEDLRRLITKCVDDLGVGEPACDFDFLRPFEFHPQPYQMPSLQLDLPIRIRPLSSVILMNVCADGGPIAPTHTYARRHKWNRKRQSAKYHERIQKKWLKRFGMTTP